MSRGPRPAEEAGIDAYVARPQRGSAVSHGLFRKEEFRYDAGSDTYLCPGGQRLEPRYHSEVKGHALVNYCNPERLSDLSAQAALHPEYLPTDQPLGR